MEQMQLQSMSWIEVQFLRKAVDVLSECRRTLMYTYAFAYYLRRDNHAEIFEGNQRDLEMATEQLSHFLERDLENENLVTLKQKVRVLSAIHRFGRVKLNINHFPSFLHFLRSRQLSLRGSAPSGIAEALPGRYGKGHLAVYAVNLGF
ncbi:unnamed protein product [Nippostrongylus brasiliensis]|uniref:E3 ubiquitin-protein ligase ARIH1 (inferred by orthology to a human protein) n=1 Tax=Nippostrongylus brasiliensis TaxID=27835 RepID=A0A0N4YX90_NIPBR|nr:unnamed protein product [Nippostrongylus brasiliensis]